MVSSIHHLLYILIMYIFPIYIYLFIFNLFLLQRNSTFVCLKNVRKNETQDYTCNMLCYFIIRDFYMLLYRLLFQKEMKLEMDSYEFQYCTKKQCFKTGLLYLYGICYYFAYSFKYIFIQQILNIILQLKRLNLLLKIYIWTYIYI